MNIAPAPVVLELGNSTFVLRPSLGAAIRLAYAHELPALVKGVAEGRLSMVSAVIAETSGASLSEVSAALAPPLSRKLANAIHACMAVLAAMLDFGEEEHGRGTGGPMPLMTALESLFEVACGHIGWTADATLSATPAQILMAYRGRVQLLKALFGNSEEDDKPARTSTERDPDASAKLRMLMASGANTGA